MAGRHQPEAGADSPQALVQAGIDQGYQQVTDSIRHKPGTQLGTRDVWILETWRADNGNLFALLLVPYTHQPFCTAHIIDEKKGAWQGGHYFDNVNEALVDFMERVR